MVGTSSFATANQLTDSAATGTVSTEVVTDYAAFVDLEREWNETVARAGVTHPFLSHEWLRTWWDCFGGDARLHIVIVRDAEGRIAAIAPLLSETTRMYGMSVRCLRLLCNDHSPRADFIVADQPESSYRAIWNALSAGRDHWDVLQLSQLPRTSPTLATIAARAKGDGLATGVWPSSESPFLELTGSWETYLAGLLPKFRSNVRNRLSRLTHLGEPALEVLDDAVTVLAAREDAMRLEASGWKEQAGTAITSDPAVLRFYALLTERATTSGWLRLLFLTVNGRRIATSYGSVYRNRLFLFKTGYDPEYAKCSPFKLLTHFAIQRSYDEGLDEVDFLGDTEPWKLEWTTTTRGHDWLFVFADSARARLVRRAKFQLAPVVRRWRQ